MVKRARFSRLPPYSSVRWLYRGLENWLMRLAWPQWIMAMRIPAFLARRVAWAYFSTVWWICSTVISMVLTGSRPICFALMSSQEE